MPSDGLLWIPVTLGATAAQVVRTARQHELRLYLTSLGAAYVRFLFAWPLALLLTGITWIFTPQRLEIPPAFALWAICAALVQIVGTVLLLNAFRARDFAIGTVYSKAEVILVAAGSALFLGESLEPFGWLGAAVVLLGVVLLAATSGLGIALRRWGDPAAWYGVMAGFFFALSAIGIRGASTSLSGGDVWHRTCITLLALLTAQTMLYGLFLGVTNRQQLLKIWEHRYKCLQVGVLSFAGTTGWIAAMTLTTAAKVRTLGQLEIVVAFFISLMRFKEEHHFRDYLGSALVLVGILLVVGLG
ncbi:MAG: hypothetical protein CL456_11480 [Acidimicrobiaceae bacterium]|nr:hypothetical protein [Acidimicrobiaceae bacterium]|tara:strand:- start:16164 stop:17069 length:906 start_codon:yes stop_codon:yes gene_type:complete